MSLFSKGETTTNSNKTTEKAPPSWALPLFQQAAKDAQSLYQEQKNNGIYKGQRVSDLSDTTKNAISGLEQSVENYKNSTIQKNLDEAPETARNLEEIARGQERGKNTNFDKSLENSLSQTADLINSKMSGAGRYGSGANTIVLAKTLGDVATKAKSEQYNHDIEHMMNANQMIDHAQNDKINTANNYYKGQNQALLNMFLGGKEIDKNAQDKLNAAQKQWQEQENSGWDRLNNLLNAGNKAAGNYGTQNSNENSSMHKNRGVITQSFLDGILKSDRRAKEEIIPCGTRNGFPLYIFAYKGNKQRYLGVMAQDVLKIMPEAISIDVNDGLMQVDYKKIGFPMYLFSSSISGSASVCMT